MFVQSNTIKATQCYVKDQLGPSFSESEIRKIFKLIICIRLGWKDSEFLLNQESRLSESDLLFVRSVVKRLLIGEPFQYILGETEFFGLTLFCSPSALIPRPETEELVQLILNSIDNSSPLSIADLCTGSGCIGIALGVNLPQASILFSDCSEEALDLARENASRNKVNGKFLRHNILNKDSFDQFLPDSFDVVVSNPPYIPQKDKDKLKPNVLDHEPHVALFVENNDPLIFYRRIALNAKKIIKSGGLLFFEINPDSSEDLVILLKDLGFVNIELMKDLQGKYRMLKVQNS
ncbi:MAG: peptide chain release factor N(5)-glutamine methyltransferase [Bacteroidetes bacterium]|nr:peptide chain release factor N(5)-glutamine methyltransferase [Bacteroidota bacterium]